MHSSDKRARWRGHTADGSRKPDYPSALCGETESLVEEGETKGQPVERIGWPTTGLTMSSGVPKLKGVTSSACSLTILLLDNLPHLEAHRNWEDGGRRQ